MVVAEAEEKGDNTQQEELHKEGSQAAGDHADHHPPLINLTHLKEYLDLPVQVDAKMIHDVLGVSLLSTFFFSFHYYFFFLFIYFFDGFQCNISLRRNISKRTGRKNERGRQIGESADTLAIMQNCN